MNERIISVAILVSDAFRELDILLQMKYFFMNEGLYWKNVLIELGLGLFTKDFFFFFPLYEW